MKLRQLVTVFLVVFALSLIGSTIAAPFAEPPVDPVSPNVTLTTQNSTNAEYVRSTADGNVSLDFTASNPAPAADGLNPEARTYVADVFRIRYDGDTAATVWITSDADGITFLADGAPVDARADAVTLAPDESVAVGVVVDTTAARPESSEFTVRARVADAADESDPAGGFAAPDSEESVTTRITRPTPTSRVLTLRNTAAGRFVELGLDRLVVARAGDGALTLDELSVVSDGGDLDLDVSVTPTDSAGSVPADAGVRPLGTVRVVERRGTVERATLRFGVDRAYLDAVGYAPEDLTVYRYDGSEWSERGVEVATRGDERVILDSETPGFSTFVVAAEVPELRVTAADLRTTTVAPGERTTVTAEVTNAGGASGGRTVALTVGGEPVAERRIELEAGASTTVTFRVDRSSAGTYTVRVGSADAGRLVVEGGAATSPPSTPGNPSVETPADRTGMPVVEPASGAPAETLWLVVVVALVVALSLARRFRG